MYLGGLLAVWLLVHNSESSELKDFAIKNLFEHVPLEDLEQHLNVVKYLDEELRIKSSQSKQVDAEEKKSKTQIVVQ